MRGWQEMKSPTQETARSSVRSSMSDLSSGPSKDMPSKWDRYLYLRRIWKVTC